MKKSSRYIVICITALFLSICIPVVSFADNVYISSSVTSDGTLSSSIPNWSSVSNIHVSFVDENISFPINQYFYYKTPFKGNSTFNKYIWQSLNITDLEYDYLTSVFVYPVNTENNTIIDFRIGTDTVHSVILSPSELSQSGSKQDEYVHLIWNSAPFMVTQNDYTLSLQVVSFSLYELYYSESYDNIYFTTMVGCREHSSAYVEYIIPVYKWELCFYNSGDDTSGDTSGGGVDLSGIENRLDDLTQSIGESITATNEVRDEVSRLGDDISQFHNELTSYDESDGPNVNDYNMSDNIDTINSFDTEISNFIDENNGYTSYDYESEYSGIGDNFSWDEQTEGDMSFWEFVVSLWGTLQMRVIIVAFVPLAFAFVILKFVIGGIM